MSSSIFSGTPIPPQPQGSDSSTSGPLWLQEYVYNLANAAGNLAGSPYTPFPGATVAQPSDTTRRAWDLAAQNVGNYQGPLSQALSSTQAGATPVGAGDINQYLNPYTNSVVGALQTAANKNLFENQLPQIQDRFVSAGQSRSPQEMQATNNALYQSNQALDSATASALQQGYSGALGAALQSKGQQLQGGAQFGALGSLQQQLAGYDVGQLAASGQSQDTQNQANLNAAQNDFYAQQQWPYQNLSYASNILRGQPTPTNTQTVGQFAPSQSAYTASPLSAFIGTTLGATALSNAQNRGTTSGLFGLKQGGRVPANENRRGALSMYRAA